jgi:hypothetical protein
MLIAAIDVHSVTAKYKTRQARLWRGIGSGSFLPGMAIVRGLGRGLGTDHI